LWLLLPLVFPIFLGDSRALHLRYAFVLPVYLVFVSLALTWLAGFLRERQQTLGFSLGLLLLIGLSLSGVLTVYQQQKPDWRGAADLVNALAGPGDLVVTGPLWDDGRFFSYYYPKPEQVLPPPTLVLRLPDAAAKLAESEGRLWLVTRYPPGEMKRFTPHELYGVTVMEQTEPNYDPAWMIRVGADLCQEAARSAYEWAEAMEADGVLNPDPRSSQAAAYRCQGDVYTVVGDYESALKPYQKMVESFPAWAGGYVILAKTYLAVDNLPAAADAFGRAVQLNPEWQGPQTVQAEKLSASEQWPEAVALYQTVIQE
jgi:tetratricopeptide (TPR) repeat protein